jgi:hypothetical protein
MAIRHRSVLVLFWQGGACQCNACYVCHNEVLIKLARHLHLQVMSVWRVAHMKMGCRSQADSAVLKVENDHATQI